VIAGKRGAALPAPMSWLATLFRLAMEPSGSGLRLSTPTGASAVESVAEAEAEAEAEVTAVVSAAAGGVHLDVVVTLAVAVSVTELTDVALDATAILASRLAGCLAVTELILHEAVPSALAQPLLNSGFRLDGFTASATVTPDADPFFVETCTT
jgi:hypothetical protein